jgi:hypothetical protein
MLDERGVAWPNPAERTLAASEVPNALIWRCGTVIAVKPTSAQNGGSARILLELLDHSVWSRLT